VLTQKRGETGAEEKYRTHTEKQEIRQQESKSRAVPKSLFFTSEDYFL